MEAVSTPDGGRGVNCEGSFFLNYIVSNENSEIIVTAFVKPGKKLHEVP